MNIIHIITLALVTVFGVVAALLMFLACYKSLRVYLNEHGAAILGALGIALVVGVVVVWVH